MPTVSRGLPRRPHLDIPKRQARELLEQWRTREPEALARIRERHPKFRVLDEAAVAAATFRLADAQLVIAREYTYATWGELKRRIEADPIVHALEVAIQRNTCAEVVSLLRAHPDLLHLPVRGGNWGPPMSYAANLGRMEIIEAVAALGARDFQHAFERALLQGKIEAARWLHARGATLAPGIVMGACETLSVDGLQFLVETGAPIADQHGNRLAPLALALETYGRNPARKHAVLDIFAVQGYHFPDTPIVALHRGRADRLADHLDRNPGLLAQRFALREIYPPELGCAEDGRSGLHGTPIDGTTLLHLAIDFDEAEIFDLLLARGADVDGSAAVDGDGFGGHTPLFNSVVSCAFTNGRQTDAAMTRALLARGAKRDLRASVRKFLDWCDKPRWHEARDVTAAQWAADFPERGWVNPAALALLAGG